MITVLFFSFFREIAGEREHDFLGPPNLDALARLLVERYGEKMQTELFPRKGESLSRELIIMINGKHYAHTGWEKSPLQDGDTVALFPLLGGG